MPLAGRDNLPQSISAPLGGLLNRARCLLITTPRRTGAWLAEALAADSATQVLLEEATSPGEGLARLVEEVFDAVLVSHEPGELEALELIEGLRAGGCEQPLVVLGDASETELAPLCFEVGADAYVSVPSGTARGLLWLIARAIERRQLQRENRRLLQAQRHRLQQEQGEVERLLAEQRALAAAVPSDPPTAGELPAALKDHYRELLRTHVIMGSGNLLRETAELAAALVKANVSPGQALLLHADALAELIRSLGNRSGRQVMTRADLMALELLLHMTSGYRRKRLSPGEPA